MEPVTATMLHSTEVYFCCKNKNEMYQNEKLTHSLMKTKTKKILKVKTKQTQDIRKRLNKNE